MSRKPRRRAWGSITTKSKTVHVLRWVEDTPQGRKRRSRTFHGTYRDACLELDRIHVERGNAGPSVTVGRAYSMWYEPWQARRLADGKVSAATVKRYTSCWANVVAPRWSRVPLDAVRPLDVQAWLLELTHGNAAVALTILRKVGDFAVQYEVVAANKFRTEYELPSARKWTKSVDVYDLARANAAWERVRGSFLEPPFLLACFGGCRTGESLGALCAEIELVQVDGVPLALVPISRTVGTTGDISTTLKTAQSYRTAVVPAEYGLRVAELARCGCEWFADCGTGVGPLGKSSLNHYWPRVMGADAIPFANLRASWRTIAQMEWGIDYDTCECLMGHALPGVTGAHYLKPSVEQLAANVARAFT